MEKGERVCLERERITGSAIGGERII